MSGLRTRSDHRVRRVKTHVVDVDLSGDPLAWPAGTRPGHSLFVLLRWRGRPIGTVRLPPGARLGASELWAAMPADVRECLVEIALDDLLPPPAGAPVPPRARPSCTVAICTRDRPEDLRRCLDSVCAVRAAASEVLVVDNAPSDGSTARLVEAYPVRYVREPQPGLNWARARAVREAKGEVILFTDDDVVIDGGWIEAMRAPFVDPRVGAVTGLVLPIELETDAQQLFEDYGGFSRGFRRLEFEAPALPPSAAGRVGAGASMAFRRALAAELGFFETALDCGTPTKSGGDTYAFYCLLQRGLRIVYTPEALAWHRHRREMGPLRSTLRGYSTGVYAFLLRCVHDHGDTSAIRVGWAWFREHHLAELWRAVWRSERALPLDLVLAEIRGCLEAPYAYLLSRRSEREVRRASSRLPAGSEAHAR